MSTARRLSLLSVGSIIVTLPLAVQASASARFGDLADCTWLDHYGPTIRRDQYHREQGASRATGMGQYAEHSGHVTDQREPVSHRVLRRLPQMISDRDFKPGAPLPARRTLAGEPDVGRSLLGEALPVMRMLGLVSREPGLRTRVLGQSVAGDTVSRRWRYGSRHSERRVFEVRLRLEAGAARLVAERVNPESLAGLTTCLVAMKATIRAADRIGIHLQA